MPTCIHCSLTLILLYDGHCFLVRVPSKVTRGFPHHVRLPMSHNNALQYIVMFPNSTINLQKFSAGKLLHYTVQPPPTPWHPQFNISTNNSTNSFHSVLI